uniref:Uncharacterized protein n=1 Tax=Rhizophora mucronata TaxID=61149 RepID=A0A2P2NCB9_RHIMU
MLVVCWLMAPFYIILLIPNLFILFGNKGKGPQKLETLHLGTKSYQPYLFISPY